MPTWIGEETQRCKSSRAEVGFSSSHHSLQVSGIPPASHLFCGVFQMPLGPLWLPRPLVTGSCGHPSRQNEIGRNLRATVGIKVGCDRHWSTKSGAHNSEY